jgi:pimeloyl-ACP methyl ester carboxylesterase
MVRPGIVRLQLKGCSRYLLAALLPALLTACQQPVSSSSPARDLSGSLAGAAYAIKVPAGWNGTLLLFSHGTILPPARGMPAVRGSQVLATTTPALSKPEQDWFLGHGYALAASAFSRPEGWAVEQAVPDQIALLDHFRRAIGPPQRTIAWGDSQGGLDTVLLLERYPDRFSGGLSVCGMLAGGLSFFNWDLDMFVALNALLAPGRIVHAGAQTRAGIDASQADNLVLAAQAEATGRARLALVAALEDFPEWFDPQNPSPEALPDRQAALVSWIRFELGTAWREDVETRAQGNPSWNTDVDYAQRFQGSTVRRDVEALYQAAGLDLGQDLARLNAAPRIAADPQAVKYMTTFGQPGGALRKPLLTLHSTADGRVLPGNERTYAGMVARQGDPAQLRQVYVRRAGHCSLTDGEVIAAFQALAQRVTTGRWPSLDPARLNAQAMSLGDRYSFNAVGGTSVCVGPKNQLPPSCNGFPRDLYRPNRFVLFEPQMLPR